MGTQSPKFSFTLPIMAFTWSKGIPLRTWKNWTKAPKYSLEKVLSTPWAMA